MLRRPLLAAFALFLFAAGAQAQSGGEQDLALGREALVRKDYIAALEHLSRATGALDPERDRENLADAWLQLGLTYLNGLDRPEPALAAFLKSAETGSSPESAWLWASVAAEKLGRTEEAAQYKARAIPPTPSPAPEPEPESAVQSVPVAAAEPVRPAPEPEPAVEPREPKEKPDAFRHFFGGKKKEEERPAKTEEKKPEAEVEKKEGETVDAFEYFFGKKRKEKKEEETSAEPPPTSPARSPARTG